MEAAIYDEELRFFLDFAATTIQRWFRGYRVRKVVHAQVRAWEAREAELLTQQSTHNVVDWAVRTIQAAWQSFRNKRIYQYYRDLVQFRERGDPREMLRAINPREAQLADAASGIHVRFRLGGTMFPPLVFYKIFTHRSIADINAFGPRNYAGELTLPTRDLHNKPPGPGARAEAAPDASVQAPKPRKTFEGDFEVDRALREFIRPDGTLGLRSEHGWYARTDNNGWRPVAERILLDEDPVTTITRLRRTPLFYYDPAVRRAARLRRAKQRQREWLVRLYSSQAMQETLGAGELGPQARGPLPAFLEEEGVGDNPEGEGLPDQQADALLDWCRHLDFGEYTSEWTSMACTLASEAFMPGPEPSAVLNRMLPPPSQDVRAAMVAAGVPLQPFLGSY